MGNNLKKEIESLITDLLSNEIGEELTPISLTEDLPFDPQQTVFVATFNNYEDGETEILGSFSENPIDILPSCFEQDEHIVYSWQETDTITKIATNYGVYQIRETPLN